LSAAHSNHKDWNDALRANDDDPLATVDPGSRTEIENFIEELGAMVTHVIPYGDPDPVIPKVLASSWEEWRHQCLDRIFALGRTSLEEVNRICPRYSPSLKGQALYDWAERYDKALQRRRPEDIEECLEALREAGWTWARWKRWRQEAPSLVEEWRRQNQDEAGGDFLWMLRKAKLGSEKTRRAVALALPEYRVHPKTPESAPQTACAVCCGMRYRRKHSGGWLCATCHPAPTPADVPEWIGPESESSADIAARSGKHIDPETGIWPIAEWGPECERGIFSQRPKDLQTWRRGLEKRRNEIGGGQC
jgi:hypothetical protein